MPVLFALAATRNFNRHCHEVQRFREEVGHRLLLGDGEAMGEGDAGDEGGPHGRFLPWGRVGPWELYNALRMNACDYVMPDFMRIGGVTGWQRAAAIAGAAGIPVSTHLYPEVAAHVMRVTETAHWLEWQDWANPILKQPYEIRDSELQIPDLPGVGLEWDEKAVSANLADSV